MGGCGSSLEAMSSADCDVPGAFRIPRLASQADMLNAATFNN
jgi:hypothetical protein